MNACLVSNAEARASVRIERAEERREQAKAALVAEYLDAAKQPLITTVHTPTDLQPFRRTPFLDKFEDGLAWSQNRKLLARVVNELNRSTLGQAILAELAEQYADDFVDEVGE